MDDSATLLALTPEEARTAEAIFERLFPADATGPGAREIGAVRYLDRALAGAYSDQLTIYRDGLERLDGVTMARHGQGFTDCAPGQQDGLLGDLEAGRLDHFERPDQ